MTRYPTPRRASATFTPATWFTETLRGYVVVQNLVPPLCKRPASKTCSWTTPVVLVDDTGCARIADFGLATVTQNLDSIRSASRQHGHTPRWTAPEILKEEGVHSKESDIFSFAMVMIEVRRGRSAATRTLAYHQLASIQVFTGAVPFSGGSTFVAMLAITEGRHPPRPTHPTLTDSLWTFMRRCWDQDPHLRPEVSEAVQVLLTPSVFHSFW